MPAKPKLFYNFPIALKLLLRERSRSFVAIIGIGFAALLMYMQLGFQTGLLNSATNFYRSLDADLFVISRATSNSGSYQLFPQSLLYRSLGFDSVKEAIPLYITNIRVQSLDGVKAVSLRLIGVDPSKNIFNLKEVRNQMDKLSKSGYVLFDEFSVKRVGPIANTFRKDKNLTMILSDYTNTFRVAGLFKLGSTFAADGNLIASDSTMVELAARQLNPGEISLGAIRVKYDNEVENVQTSLQKIYGDELEILSKDELIAREENYWNQTTALGVVFGFGTIMGFLVGGVIVYQVLYTDIVDHIKEYATLKAIGFSQNYLLYITFQQSLLMALAAFIPSSLASLMLYSFLSSVTSIAIKMSLLKIVQVAFLMVSVCSISAFIATRKLREADPASVFN